MKQLILFITTSLYSAYLFKFANAHFKYKEQNTK